MKKILLPLILLFTFIIAHSQSGTITNIQLSQRTDGSGLIDVYFDLAGEANTYNILFEPSFDGGQTYAPVSQNYFEGDTEAVTPGADKQIIWNGQESFPNTFSTKALLKIIAMEAIGAGIPCPGMPTFTDPRDGNVYKTVLIGDQCWLKENLKYLPEVYPSSEDSGEEVIPYKSLNIDKSGSNLYYYVYEYEGSDIYEALATDNYHNYGVLYNWHAALKACPTEWHLPSHDEWTELIDFIVSQGYSNEYNNPNGAGNALKSCSQVSSPLGGACDTSEHPRWDQGDHYGIDEFGFSALPGGLLYPPVEEFHPEFIQVGTEGNWWSSTQRGETYAYSIVIYKWYGYVSSLTYQLSKAAGLSIRCIRDN